MPFGGASKSISTNGSRHAVVPTSPSLWILMGWVNQQPRQAGAGMFTAPRASWAPQAFPRQQQEGGTALSRMPPCRFQTAAILGVGHEEHR